MSDYIKTFDKGSKEHNALQAFADRVNAKGSPVQLQVEDCYFDFGQNWMWTTLIAHDTTKDPSNILSSWQALSPKDQEYVIEQNEEQLVLLEEKLLSGRR